MDAIPDNTIILTCRHRSKTVNLKQEVDEERNYLPTVNVNLLSKHLFSNSNTSCPSALSGRYAVRPVPENLIPGFGCSGP
jgi:hypothetical protein